MAFGDLTYPPTLDIVTSDLAYFGEYTVEWWVIPVHYPAMPEPIRHSFTLDLTYILCETATCLPNAISLALLFGEVTTFTGHECSITSAAGDDVNSECGPPTYGFNFQNPWDGTLVTAPNQSGPSFDIEYA